MNGQSRDISGFSSLEAWIVYVCLSEGEWGRQDSSAFEQGMVVGAKRTLLSVSRTATLLGFPRSTVSSAF